MSLKNLNQYIFQLPRGQKRLIMLLADSLLLPLALWISFALRLSTWTPDLKEGEWLLLLVPLVTIPAFIRLGLYRAIIRFLGQQAIYAIFKGVLFSALALVILAYIFKLEGIPRSVYIIYFINAFLLVAGSRHFMRRLYHGSLPQSQKTPVAIYGAGASGAQLAQALFSSPEYHPVLFLDDDPTLQKSFIHSLKVYAPTQLDALLKPYGIQQVLLAMPSASPHQRRAILQKLEPLAVHVRSIPGMAELVSGKRSIAEIREIEIDELLGRAPVAPNEQLLSHCIRHKTVMVTGAGGSIGSELCRQILKWQPSKLVLFESSEFALYQIERELLEDATYAINVAIVTVLGSVQNQQRVKETLTLHQVNTLYHAAAYKHVPLVEHNPIEGLRNNTLGTYRTAEAALNAGVEHFVLISTDKAVRPTNVMGASKRLAELVLQGFAQRSNQTCFSMVRFGNVLGSSGSVVPLFRRQIKAGGPITVTHPDIIRYFMTIPEAAQLVIQAGAMAKGGEVFLLDMGEPVKIVDLARRMIHLSGLSLKDKQHLEGDIAIKFTGLRPGEKLYEELLIEDQANPTEHPRIFKANEAYLPWTELVAMIEQLQNACHIQNMQTLYSLLECHVQGYQRPEIKPVALVSLPETLPVPDEPEPLIPLAVA